MKKWLLAILVILILLIGCIYIFIPAHVNITDYTLVNATADGTYRILSDTGKWALWWPKDTLSDPVPNTKSSTSFSFHHYTYTPAEKLYHAIKVSIQRGQRKFPSKILILPLPRDSVLIKWESSFNTGLNPVEKAFSYRDAIQIEDNMPLILKELQSFLNDNKNIYGYSIRQVIVKDSFLVYIKKILPYYPQPQEVYALIHQLNHFAQENGAKPTDSPMLNVRLLPNHRFETRVAIPIDKELTNSGNIIAKRLVTGGNMIVTTVTGGRLRIQEAFAQMETYIHDHQQTILAIPFQSLITNRLLEPDSTKWVTRLSYPIM